MNLISSPSASSLNVSSFCWFVLLYLSNLFLSTISSLLLLLQAAVAATGITGTVTTAAGPPGAPGAPPQGAPGSPSPGPALNIPSVNEGTDRTDGFHSVRSPTIPFYFSLPQQILPRSFHTSCCRCLLFCFSSVAVNTF